MSVYSFPTYQQWLTRMYQCYQVSHSSLRVWTLFQKLFQRPIFHHLLCSFMYFINFFPVRGIMLHWIVLRSIQAFPQFSLTGSQGDADYSTYSAYRKTLKIDVLKRKRCCLRLRVKCTVIGSARLRTWGLLAACQGYVSKWKLFSEVFDSAS